jgi:hypothetical protein
MAINPNTDFSSGAVLTAAQQNRFPRGVMALATSTTSMNITTSPTTATGMTVTFTAVANRYYRVTYYEPQVTAPNVSGGFVVLSIRQGGTQYSSAIVQTQTGGYNALSNNIFVGTFTAGSVTLTGTVTASSTTGTPAVNRGTGFPAQLTVEDIGPA